MTRAETRFLRSIATSTSARCSTRISNAGSAFAQVASSSGCADTVGVAASKITSAVNTSDGTAWINIQATGDAAGVAAAEDITLLSWSVKVQPGS